MKYYHIVPQKELHIRCADRRSVFVERISVCMENRSWQVRATVSAPFEDAVLAELVGNHLGLTGTVTVEQTVREVDREPEGEPPDSEIGRASCRERV